MSRKTVDRVGKGVLDAINFGGRGIIPFQDGGFTSVQQGSISPTINNTLQPNFAVNVENRIIGNELVTFVNITNTDFDNNNNRAEANKI